MNNNPLKICLFGTYFYNYARNSSIRDGLKALDAEVTEAYVETPPERMELPEDFTPVKSLRRVWRKIRASFALLGQYKKIRNSDIVIVLFPSHLVLPVAWILCRLFGKKLVFDTSISLYDTMINDRSMAGSGSFKASLLKLAETILLKLPDLLFTDTNLVREYIISEFGIPADKIFVVPLGANNRLYTPMEIAVSSPVRVLFFGLYNPLQGAPVIVRAAQLLAANPNIQITMLGDGPLKQQVVDFATENNLSNVKFLPFMPEPELVKNIQDCDIMLGIFSNSRIASRVVANKVFAALACKKPLISAKSPAMVEFFKHKEHVYYCEPENPESLAAAISDLASDIPLQKHLSEAGYNIYREMFTPEKIGQMLLEGIKT
jgi:glycosyltransferase involved in cell wall biosynthesis